ncbi:type II toxin-antitoxin system RelE/ParE family toxin [Oxalobacter vibrioformis]|uniref:Type II toxin-antitoxin system RelE/ParE family toxin n=1 Tax=Oxalobacter vibrioformis TaxID=933080 RepID=A0A9E9LXY6_9BURK|nr:type II toxin-antitoxin system RelE/ParE family toxin [Oxalobacter vibrioformis]WAW09273.1 type II toxin-antitoxin system RelE/ParE family toxin [Oxalobacter vibrioformis]
MNTIEWQPKAFRQLRKIQSKGLRETIYDAVQLLATWPSCNADIKKLQGRDGYRLRVGDFRVIFEIDQSGSPIIINIVQVGKRNESTY